MKKLIAVCLVLVLSLGMLAGCGGNAESKNLADAKSLADLKGAKIAAQAGTFHADALSQIEDVKSSTYPDFTDLLVALQSGAIDGYVAEEPTALSVCASDETLTYVKLKNNDTGFTATKADVGVAVGLVTGSELTEKINTVLAEITEDQRAALMAQIVDITAGKTVDKICLESEEPENPTGVLKVAMECAYEPFNWTEIGKKSAGAVAISGEGKEDLYANGYDIQIAKYIANRLGLKLEVYAIEWDSLLPAVQSGTVDAIIAGMSPTEEREKEIDFTNTYYESNLVVIVKK